MNTFQARKNIESIVTKPPKLTKKVLTIEKKVFRKVDIFTHLDTYNWVVNTHKQLQKATF